MMHVATELRLGVPHAPILEEPPPPEILADRSDPRLAKLRLLWDARNRLRKAAIVGLVSGILVAWLPPVKFESMAQLMPPDPQSGSGMALLAALSARTGSPLEGVSGDLLGLKSSGALFIGILGSRTVQDRLSARFNLRKVYGCRRDEDARKKLAENTRVWEDRHSGIISLAVTDHDPKRAADMAGAYVEELNRLVAELSTSSAHRERVFLEQRLVTVKQSLDQASGQFSEFASRNKAVDIKEQGRALIDVAANLAGQLIAAQSELSGLEQIYNPNNVRVRSLDARIRELRGKLEELGGGEPKTNAQPGEELRSYPTLRELPLLGVTYADLYRESKIQESVYETLTGEYELAKVQEAKETPSVKVLDSPQVPETHSFPPRLQIVFFSICLLVTARALSILGKARWQAIDQQHPYKTFAREVIADFHAGTSRVGFRNADLPGLANPLHWILRTRPAPVEAASEQR